MRSEMNSVRKAGLLVALAAMIMLSLPEADAEAARLWTSVPKPFVCGPGGKIVPNNSCLEHTGFRPNKNLAADWGQELNPKGNCTKYVAFRLRKNGASRLAGSFGNAVGWRKVVRERLGGRAVDNTPAVGAIAWWDAYSKKRSGIGWAGHVAYVEKVSPDGKTLYLSESHWDRGSSRLKLRKGSGGWRVDAFLHIKDKPSPPPLSRYDGHIVQWKGDKKPQRTAWLVGPDLKRRWIPDIATYQCLKARGVRGPIPLSARILDKLEDLNGKGGRRLEHAKCTLPPAPPPAPRPASEPSPPSDPAPTPSPPSKSEPKPDPRPKAEPKPSVKLSKGDSAQGLSGCASVYCRFLVVKFKNFSGGTHKIKCRASHGSEGGYYTYTRSGSSNTSAYCYYGFPGHTVWVTVDGVKSNKVVW